MNAQVEKLLEAALLEAIRRDDGPAVESVVSRGVNSPSEQMRYNLGMIAARDGKPNSLKALIQKRKQPWDFSGLLDVARKSDIACWTIVIEEAKLTDHQAEALALKPDSSEEIKSAWRYRLRDDDTLVRAEIPLSENTSLLLVFNFATRQQITIAMKDGKPETMATLPFSQIDGQEELDRIYDLYVEKGGTAQHPRRINKGAPSSLGKLKGLS